MAPISSKYPIDTKYVNNNNKDCVKKGRAQTFEPKTFCLRKMMNTKSFVLPSKITTYIPVFINMMGIPKTSWPYIHTKPKIAARGINVVRENVFECFVTYKYDENVRCFLVPIENHSSVAFQMKPDKSYLSIQIMNGTQLNSINNITTPVLVNGLKPLDVDENIQNDLLKSMVGKVQIAVEEPQVRYPFVDDMSRFFSLFSTMNAENVLLFPSGSADISVVNDSYFKMIINSSNSDKKSRQFLQQFDESVKDEDDLAFKKVKTTLEQDLGCRLRTEIDELEKLYDDDEMIDVEEIYSRIGDAEELSPPDNHNVYVDISNVPEVNDGLGIMVFKRTVVNPSRSSLELHGQITNRELYDKFVADPNTKFAIKTQYIGVEACEKFAYEQFLEDKHYTGLANAFKDSYKEGNIVEITLNKDSLTINCEEVDGNTRHYSVVKLLDNNPFLYAVYISQADNSKKSGFKVCDSIIQPGDDLSVKIIWTKDNISANIRLNIEFYGTTADDDTTDD